MPRQTKGANKSMGRNIVKRAIELENTNRKLRKLKPALLIKQSEWKLKDDLDLSVETVDVYDTSSPNVSFVELSDSETSETETPGWHSIETNLKTPASSELKFPKIVLHKIKITSPENGISQAEEEEKEEEDGDEVVEEMEEEEGEEDAGNDEVVEEEFEVYDSNPVSDAEIVVPDCITDVGFEVEVNDQQYYNDNSKADDATVLNGHGLELDKLSTMGNANHIESGDENESDWNPDDSVEEFINEPSCSKLFENLKVYETKDSKSIVICAPHPTQVSFKGELTVQVLKGIVEIFGFEIKQNSGIFPVCSVEKQCLLPMKTLSPGHGVGDRTEFLLKLQQEGLSTETASSLLNNMEDNDVVLSLKYHKNLACSYIRSHFRFLISPGEHSTRSFSLVDFDSGSSMTYGDSWESIVKSLLSSSHPPRVVICGGKDVGKTTLLRYLVNCTLKKYKCITFLDADPGQSEFTPSGMLSLVQVTQPCLGPAFSHHQTPHLMLYFGEVTAANNPQHYMACINKLCEVYRIDPILNQSPLFVNTMGWILGMGLQLNVGIVIKAEPTHLIQINSTRFHKRNAPSFKPDFIQWIVADQIKTGIGGDVPNLNYELYEINSDVNNKSIVKPSSHRDMNFMAHFSSLQPQLTQFRKFLPIVKCRTLRISWASVAIHVSNETVDNSNVLYVLNGSVVALCKCHPDDCISIDDPTLPKFLKYLPVCECLGFGIVRGIDAINKIFYIITPVSLENLKSVNALIKGDAAVPMEMLLKQGTSGFIPYMASKRVFTHGELASKPKSSRLSFKPRKKFMK